MSEVARLLISLLAVHYPNYSGQTILKDTSAKVGNLRSLSENYHPIGKQREHSRSFFRVAKQYPMKITDRFNARTELR